MSDNTTYQVWMTATGELFLVYATIAFNKAVLNEKDDYPPIFNWTLAEHLGAEYLGEL